MTELLEVLNEFRCVIIIIPVIVEKCLIPSQILEFSAIDFRNL